MKDPLAALEAIGQTCAFLTYEIGHLQNGDRLDKLKPQLEGIQQAVSKVNAMLIMNPDATVTYDTMSDEDVAELAEQDRELEHLVSLPSADTEVHVTANPRDRRRIAQELAEAVAGVYPAEVTPSGLAIDLSEHITALTALIDPYGEGYPYEHDETEEHND